jgi:nitroimidazol reductase NimA-like FMN-containing flavoprotein (pyridoxamine 5'-phosphate oxidase superfamily)
MRRSKQALSQAQALEILQSHTSGVLAVSGDDGYPYAVPLSYALKDGKLFFHSAGAGHKIDALQRSDKVSFCVIDRDEIVPEQFTTHFRSVIVFGRARLLTDDAERYAALESLVEKYSPEQLEERRASFESDLKRVTLFEIEIEQITAKAAIELLEK